MEKKRLIPVILCAAVMLGSSSWSWAAVRRVPEQYQTIQAAVNAAVSGDTIEVSNGTYPGNITIFSGKALTVKSKNGSADCIIKGDGSGRGFYLPDTPTAVTIKGFTITQFNHAVSAYGSSVVIANCVLTENTGSAILLMAQGSPTVSNCTITKSGNSSEFGGGINCQFGCTPTITNCKIMENVAGSGGGLSAVEGASVTLTGCTITGNQAKHGGGIYCEDSGSFARINSCEIRGNTADEEGGGLNLWYRSSARISNSRIAYNKAAEGGGVYSWLSPEVRPVLSRCAITGNEASGSGGGINCDGTAWNITNCTIIGNKAGEMGGGIYTESSASTISRCTIAANQALNQGGGIAARFGSPRITDCAITGNSASFLGGGVYSSYSSSLISNCTVTGNQAIGYRGGGIYCSSDEIVTNCLISENSSNKGAGITCEGTSGALITNCTITGNEAGDVGGGILSESSRPIIANCILWDDTPDEIHSNSRLDYFQPVVTYSDLKGGYKGKGNRKSDPLFADAAAGDFHLLEGSPCKDHGNNKARKVPKKDKNGNPRVVNGIVDMGAYEFGNAPPPIVRVVGVDPDASESGPEGGMIQFIRTGATEKTLKVKSIVDGTAANGQDYEKLTATVEILDGAVSVDVAVIPKDDALEEEDESVVLVVSIDNTYEVGFPSFAAVTISDND